MNETVLTPEILARCRFTIEVLVHLHLKSGYDQYECCVRFSDDERNWLNVEFLGVVSPEKVMVYGLNAELEFELLPFYSEDDPDRHRQLVKACQDVVARTHLEAIRETLKVIHVMENA